MFIRFNYMRSSIRTDDFIKKKMILTHQLYVMWTKCSCIEFFSAHEATLKASMAVWLRHSLSG
jgi:hypothetical protein